MQDCIKLQGGGTWRGHLKMEQRLGRERHGRALWIGKSHVWSRSMHSGVWGRKAQTGTEKEQRGNSELTELIPPDGGRAGLGQIMEGSESQVWVCYQE